MVTDQDSTHPVRTGAVPDPPPQPCAPLVNAFIDYATLKPRVPLCDRVLRQQIRDGIIPSILLPGARKRLFHWPSVEAALKRHQQVGPR